jgi:hypothetical protein
MRGICELVLEARDLERLERFYLWLGLTPLSRDCDRVWLAAGSRCRLGIWSPGPKEHDDRGGRHVHFALSVSRGTLERITAKLRRHGIDVEGRSSTRAATGPSTYPTPKATGSSCGTTSPRVTATVRVSADSPADAQPVGHNCSA